MVACNMGIKINFSTQLGLIRQGRALLRELQALLRSLLPNNVLFQFHRTALGQAFVYFTSKHMPIPTPTGVSVRCKDQRRRDFRKT